MINADIYTDKGMFEALVYYQSLAQKFQSRPLVISAIVVVLAGLCIWLAALRFKRIVSALVGAGVAIAGISAFGDEPMKIMLTAIGIGVVAGAIAGRFMLGVFAALAGGLLAITVVSGRLQPVQAGGIEFFDANSVNRNEVTADDFVSGRNYPVWPEYQQAGVIIPAPDAVDITVKMFAYMTKLAKKTISSAGFAAIGGAAGVVLAAVFFCFVMPRFFFAAVSAAVGSAVIFAGMAMLLFYKCSEPVNLIAARPQFYSIVFGAMTVFGTVVQLILSPAKPEIIKPSVSQKENGESK